MAFCTHCGIEQFESNPTCPGCGRGSVLTQPAIYASWGSRVWATLIDMLVVGVPVMIIAVPALSSGNPGGSSPSWTLMLVVLSLAASLYKPLMEGAGGQTVGKKVTRIRVHRSDDGAVITYGTAFLRAFTAWILSFVPILPLIDVLWPLWDVKKQTLHDKMASTIVLAVPDAS